MTVSTRPKAPIQFHRGTDSAPAHVLTAWHSRCSFPMLYAVFTLQRDENGKEVPVDTETRMVIGTIM
jgi:hypothetical protein